MARTPEEALEEIKVDLLSKYLKAQSELLDAKLLLRAILDHPEGDPTIKQMIWQLAKEKGKVD